MKRWILTLLVASCGDNLHPNNGADAAVDAPPDAPLVHMGTVTAHALVHHLTEAGEVTSPETNLQIIDSANNMVAPVTQADGTLKFTPVASGAYLICDVSFVIRPTCAEASVPQLDLDRYVVGRPDVVFGGANTKLSLTMNSLTASTGSNEFLDVRIQNTNDFEYPSPPASGTTLNQLLNFQNRGLLAANDVIRVTEHVTKMSGSETYVALARTGSVSNVTMVDGQTTPATVNLATVVPQSKTATFNLRRAQFNAVDGSPGPGFTYVMNDLNGLSEPMPYDDTPWIFYYVSNSSPTDLPLTITYGSPWPATNTEVAVGGFWYQRNVTAPGASTSSPITMFTAFSRPMTEITGDVGPLLSRPKALKVNGLDATVAQTNTTDTPTISWTAPSLGTATRYTVSVYRIINQSGSTVATVDGTFATTATSFKIPSGFVHSGETYMVSIRAQAIPNYSSAKPFAPIPRYEMAETITEILQP